jgi:hypothetical protein
MPKNQNHQPKKKIRLGIPCVIYQSNYLHMKNLFDVISHIKKYKRLPSIRSRIIGCSREGEQSKIYKLFCLIADEEIDNDGKLCRKLYGEGKSSAYSNLKKRLFNEVLNGLSIDIVQVENKQSFFEMRVVATTHLRNGYMLWQQKLHKIALSEFQSALQFALQSLDVYLLAHIRHQIMVLSSMNTETLPDIIEHHKEINLYFEHIPFLNDLCLLYYKVRYAEHFVSTENEIIALYKEAIATYRKMELRTQNKHVQLLIINDLKHCYEKLGMNNELRNTIKKYLDVSAPLIEFSDKYFIAKRKMLEAKYQELNHNHIRVNEILNDEDLIEFSSNNDNSILSKLIQRKQHRSKSAVDTKSMF